MNGKWILGVGVVCILCGGVWWWQSAPVIKNYPPSRQVIVAFGDSLVVGQGATAGNDFVSLLSKKIGRPIVNLGVGGNTTAQGRARLGEVIAQKPGVVLVLLGGNDYLQRIPTEETFENLRTIVSELQSSGALVVVLGVRGGVLRDHFDNDFESLAREMGAVYVPDVLDGLIGNTSLMADAVHPNDAGYVLIAEKVNAKIGKYLK